MTTRPVTFEIRVNGEGDASRAFRQLAESENSAASGLQTLRREQEQQGAAYARLQQQINRGTQVLSGFARAADLVSDALERTNPQASQLIGHLGEMSGLAAQNIQQFGLLGGAIATAFEGALPAIISGVNQLTHYRTLIQEFNSAFGEYLPEQGRRNLNALSQGSASLRDYNNGQLTPEEEQIRANQIRRAEQQGADFARLVETRVRNGRRSGGAGHNDDDAYARAMEEFNRSFEEETTAAQERLNEQFRADQEDKLQLIQRSHDQQLALQEQLNSIQEQEHQNQIRRLNEQREAHQRLSEEIQGYAQPMVGMFVGALSKVIAGTESAGDAFKGLLSDFLALISQQAALKAAFEFAEAVATFPYGTAQHVAAGVAFTAVAVAAGAGSVGLASSGGAPAPASPAANQSPTREVAQTVVINWNSPVVTAQDRNELGRSLGQMTRQGNARFAARA